ncbi:MAG: SpoIIE family protein phosphatase [Magnetococcales bacterium]|nr:SpoIIE family protein phosphatase [Magnetococcales bacterium]MBF0156974.1 SpoIIE family protein phosphatase [Magnetococcales bacterium]
MSRPIILVVDDTPENIDILKGALASEYMIRPATSGEVALRAVLVEPLPDLILLDVMMPGMDGHAVCRRLKSDPKTREIPIIFVTARSGEADELEGLRLGAVDYITKPFRIPIVQARIRTHLALRAAQVRLDEYNRRLLRERGMIESILLKMRCAERLDERYIRYLLSPVEETAGDLLLSDITPGGRQLVLLGDFTGHGLPSAVGGPLVTYILHELAAREFSGAEIFGRINGELVSRLPTGLFFAAMLIEVNPERDKALLWNAGMPEGLWFRGGELRGRFPSRLPPMGILDHTPAEEDRISLDLEPGDRLFAYSDGIVEAMDGGGNMFGSERLEAFLGRVMVGDTPLEDLLALLRAHVGASAHTDDLSLVEVRI